jgi:putative ABC transport system permease protein
MLARALRAALIPTLNSFAVAGVVQLPGMMTGQILSGVEPLLAVKYQILIFVLLSTCTALSTLAFLLTLRGRVLTPAHQLRRDLLQNLNPPRAGRGPRPGAPGARRQGGRGQA